MDNIWFVKLHRQLKDSKYYYKPDYLAIWIEILLSVNHINQERNLRWDKIILNPWEWIFFQKEISNKFWIPLTTVNRVLKCFENDWQLEIIWTSKYTIIKLLNWSKYQEMETKRKSNGNHLETLKEWKEWKEWKEIISKDIITTDFEILDSDSIEIRFKKTLWKFIEFRKKIKKPIKDESKVEFQKELEKISEYNLENAIAILNKSIAMGWQWIFPLKEKQKLKQFISYE